MSPREKRARPQRQTKRIILLVTNGESTEKIYLEQLKRSIPEEIKKKIEVRVHKPINGSPENVLRSITGAKFDLSGIDEVWIIIDHDGTDRSSFLKDCVRKTKKGKTPIEFHGVVSVPCFEVWLIAHYEQVKRYQSQKDAQAHYLRVTHLPPEKSKSIPSSFPWHSMSEAVDRCHLQGENPPALDEQGSSPSTTMPYLLRALGLLE